MLISNSQLQSVQLAPGTVPNLATAWFVGCWSCYATLGTNCIFYVLLSLGQNICKHVHKSESEKRCWR